MLRWRPSALGLSARRTIPAGMRRGRRTSRRSRYFRNFSDPALAEQRRVLFAALAALSDVPSGKAKSLLVASCCGQRNGVWTCGVRFRHPMSLRAAIVENATSMAEAARAATRKYRKADQEAPTRWTATVTGTPPRTAGCSRTLRSCAASCAAANPHFPAVPRRLRKLPPLETARSARNTVCRTSSLAKAMVMVWPTTRWQPAATGRKRLISGSSKLPIQMSPSCAARTPGSSKWSASTTWKTSYSVTSLTMNRAGFSEVIFDQLATADDGRLWRDVPGRRWWAKAGDRSEVVQHTAREVVLIHKLSQ